MKIWVDQKQQQVISSPTRFVTWMASRRRGKSKAIRALFIQKALGRINQRLCYATPFAAQSWQEYAWFRYHPVLSTLLAKDGCKTQPFPHLTFSATRSVLEFRTLENADGMRGGEFDDIAIDESQSLRLPYEDFQSIVSPMLKDRRGRLLMCGQFCGKNWVHDQFYLKGLPGTPDYDPDYFSLVSPWHECFCFQGPAGRIEAEKERRRVPAAVWQQEYECLPLDSAAAVFPLVARVIGGKRHTRPQPGCVYLLFWDTGKVADPSAVVVIEKKSGLVCVAEELPLGLEYTDALDYVAQLQRHFNAACAMDLTGAGTQDGVLAFAREKIKNMRGIYFGSKHKEALVNQASVEIEQRRIQIPEHHATLISQLKRFQFEKDPVKGFYSYHAPTGEHDDVCMALIGCLEMRNENWGNSANGRNLSTLIG